VKEMGVFSKALWGKLSPENHKDAIIIPNCSLDIFILKNTIYEV